MIFEGHRMQRLGASNLGGHLAEITYILIPRGGIARRLLIAWVSNVTRSAVLFTITSKLQTVQNNSNV